MKYKYSMGINIDKNNIINFTIKDGGAVEKLVAPINLKNFYNDLHKVLVEKGFIDMLNDPFEGGFFDHQTKVGEFTDSKNNKNRTGDMFEQKFFWMTHPDNTNETEIVWKARRKSPHTKYGWYEVKLDITCRRIVNQEILDKNNNKQVFQSGAYEFRNSIEYKNNIIPKKLSKMFLIGNSENLRNIYLKRMYGNILEADFNFGIEKIKPMIYNVINKHFKE